MASQIKSIRLGMYLAIVLHFVRHILKKEHYVSTSCGDAENATSTENISDDEINLVKGVININETMRIEKITKVASSNVLSYTVKVRPAYFPSVITVYGQIDTWHKR